MISFNQSEFIILREMFDELFLVGSNGGSAEEHLDILIEYCKTNLTEKQKDSFKQKISIIKEHT